MQPKQLTIRSVPPEVVSRLKELSARRGQSLNTTVVEILKRAVGADERRKTLERYATWDEGEARQLDSVLAEQRTVDPDLWR